jgi:hypothetical protein
LCVDEGIPFSKRIGTDVKFIKVHPEPQEKDGADIIQWTLSDEFPCKSQPDVPQTSHSKSDDMSFGLEESPNDECARPDLLS